MKRTWIGAGFVFLAIASSAVMAGEEDCGSLENPGLGPYDYNDPASRVPSADHPMGIVRRVENVHFQPEMQILNVKRFGAEQLRNEFMYTLNALPNHRFALNAFSRLEHNYGKQLNRTSRRATADCYFDRAIRFRPSDSGVRFVYALHLHLQGKLQEAAKEYALAESLGEDNANFFYNYGLLQADVKNWPEAKRYAEKAYERGAQLPGLANKIQKAGLGTIPVPTPRRPPPPPAPTPGEEGEQAPEAAAPTQK